MENLSQLEKISQKYSVSTEEFIRSGIISNLKERQRLLRIERFEMLARYQTSNIDELSQKVADGKAAEHPGWEDCNVPEEFMCPEPKLWCLGTCPLYPRKNL